MSAYIDYLTAYLAAVSAVSNITGLKPETEEDEGRLYIKFKSTNAQQIPNVMGENLSSTCMGLDWLYDLAGPYMESDAHEQVFMDEFKSWHQKFREKTIEQIVRVHPDLKPVAELWHRANEGV